MKISVVVTLLAFTGAGVGDSHGAVPVGVGGAAGGGGGPRSTNVVVRTASGGGVGGGPSHRSRMSRAARPDFGGGAGSAGGAAGYVSGGGRGSPAQLLGYKEVQNDLKLSEAQAAKIQEIRANFRQEETAAFQNTPQGPERSAKLQSALAAALNRATNQITAVLSTEQAKRLNQIGLQRRGPDALLDAGVSSALGLTDSQKRTLSAINSNVDYQIMIRTVRRIKPNAPDLRQYSRSTYANSPTGGGSASGGAGAGAGFSPQDPAVEERNNAEIAMLMRDSEYKMLHVVLTPAQQQKLEQMKGPPCKLGSGYGLSRSVSGGGFSKGGFGQ